jgi:hypothetical protein
MRFLGYTLGDPSAPIPPPTPALMDEMGKFVEEATKAGVLVATGGLGPADEGTKVRLHDGKFTVLDGPFTEAKELIGGYAVYQYRTKEEAVEQARRFMELHAEHWPAVEAVCEVRQIMEPGDFDPTAFGQ